MRLRAVLVGLGLGCIVLGGGAAHAVPDLVATLTLRLTVNLETELAGVSNDTKISRLRFATKDLVDILREALDEADLRNPSVRREDVFSGDSPPSGMLIQELVLHDAGGSEVATTGFFQAATLGLDAGLGTAALGVTAAADREERAPAPIHTRRLLGNEGAIWTLDMDGDDMTANDQIVLEMLALSELQSKRRFIGDEDLGVWFRSRTAQIHGALIADADAGLGADALTGVLTGTIRMGPERIGAPGGCTRAVTAC